MDIAGNTTGMIAIATNAEEFSAVYRRYASFAHSVTGPELLARESQKLIFELYKQTKAVAPTISDIASDVTKQGWKIPAKFPDGRIGRGTPDQWKGTAIASLPKRRGRKSKARLAEEASIASGKATLGMMQAFVIKRRVAHIGYVARGWLNAVVSTEGDEVVDVINKNTGTGMAAVEAKHGVVAKAFAARSADMLGWIQQQFAKVKQQAA
jgi:hypothetical protein